MPISKFGLSEQRNDDDSSLEQYDEKLYIRKRSVSHRYRLRCEIRRIALPIDDDDVVNKRFVQQNMQILKNGQDEIEKNITSLQTNRQFMLKYV